jgi:hypothetical protein
MSQLGPGPGRTRPAAEDDIYTALMAVAFVCVLIAAIYLAWRAVDLFGAVLPPVA